MDEEDGPPGGRGIQRPQRYSRFTVLCERFAIEVKQACHTLTDATRLPAIICMGRAVARGPRPAAARDHAVFGY